MIFWVRLLPTDWLRKGTWMLQSQLYGEG